MPKTSKKKPWVHQVQEVPDFDQRWALLGGPGLDNGGNTHCQPAASLNWAMYLRQQEPALMVGLPDSLAPEAAIVTQLVDLGVKMSADNHGTTLANAKAGYLEWLRSKADQTVPFPYVVVGAQLFDGTPITLGKLVSWLKLGAWLMPFAGFYDKLATGDFDRAYGHVLTLTGLRTNVAGAGFKGKVSVARVHDSLRPNDTYKTTQSDFANECYRLKAKTRTFFADGSSQDATLQHILPAAGLEETGAVDGGNPETPSYGRDAFIDGFLVLAAKYMVSSDGKALHYSRVRSLGHQRRIITRGAGHVIDLRLKPTAPEVAYLKSDSSVVWSANLANGFSRQLTRCEFPPRRIAYGGKRPYLYVHGGRRLLALDENGERRFDRELTAPIVNMVFDRKRDRLIVVEGAGQTDRIQVSALDPTLEERTILDRLTVPGVGRLNVAIAPDGGAIWLHRNRSTRVTRLGGAQSELRGAREPNGLVISEDGRLLFEDGRRLQAYVDSDGDLERTGDDGGPDQLRTRRLQAISESYDNFDRDTMSGPAYYHLPPELRR